MTVLMRASVPAAGLWLRTVPSGWSLGCSTTRIEKLSPRTSARAASMVLPVRVGMRLVEFTTARLTYKMTVEPPSTVSPEEGLL